MNLSWIRTLPLRRKLAAFVMTITGAAVLAALAAIFTFGLLQWRRHLAQDIATLGQVVATNAAGSLAFQRPDEARTLLAALKAHPEIAAVRLRDLGGAEFASYRGRADPGPFLAPDPGSEYRIRGFKLYAEQKVVLGGETYGSVEITADIRRELMQLAAVTAIVMLAVLAVTLGLALALAAFLQRTITEPLFALAGTAREVAQRQDYSLRARKYGGDEIGALTDAFNLMLTEIQQRDLALRTESAERLRAQEENRDLERQLEQKQRLESLGVLAGGIAHDFNNILTGILCSASLSRLDLPKGSPLDSHLARIEQNSRRAAELCEQMLAYAGKGRVSTRVLDLNVLARETLDLLHASLPSDAEVIVTLEPTLPGVRGDGARLRQVLMNLVLNAVEALGPPPRQVRVATGLSILDAAGLAALTNPESAEPGAFAVIEVSDTGVGIEPQRLRRIFEPFHTSKFAGRGLGLSAVLGIIRGSGGALHVASAVGKGTTFRVYFPATDEKLPSAPPAGAHSAPAASATSAGTVLVVDDEPAVREVAGDVLARMGFGVVAAAGGAEALSALSRLNGQVAGVLLDLTMPGMDGVTTLQELRKLKPGLKAVLMSGYDQKDTLPELEKIGFSAFLQKPFTPEALWEKTAALRGK